MRLIEYPDGDVMMMTLAAQIAEQLEQRLQHAERATLAVPGGTTPGPVFDSLSAVDLPWERVDVLLSDERWVPEDDPRSNTALLRARLLVGQAARARLLPMYAEGAPDDHVAALGAQIAPHLPLSVALLGMGADMHTASLFPGGDALEAALSGAAPLYVMRAPGAPEPRVTLSAPVLRGAMHLHIVILGADKREALERARDLPPTQAPVAALLPEATVHWAAS